MRDLRDEIFRTIAGTRVEAVIEATEAGIVAGISEAASAGRSIGCDVTPLREDGDTLRAGDTILRIVGTPKAITIAEESLIGWIAKPSGIATATRRLVEEADGRIRIVGGAWKKAPPATKAMVRHAVAVGGATGRMAEHPMVYLDKNYVRMLGGLRGALDAVAHLADHAKVVQLIGEEADLGEEAALAVSLGATTVFVDTGVPADLKPVAETLDALGVRGRVSLAFAGGVQPGDLEELVRAGADALCIGRSIVDAPLLDLRLSVVGSVRPR